MTAHDRLSRRIGWGLTAIAATTAALTTAVPAASADMVNFHILADQGVQTYYVGTKYGFSVALVGTGSDWVTFYDNGQCIGGSGGHGGSPEVGTAPVARVNWIPSTAGSHVITAKDSKTTQTLTVDVQPALPGSPPAQPTSQPGCGELDRLFSSTGSSTL
ncbi:hypothetical protein [Nocardia sp. NPDC005825]|uniref:hypothetical protein n=1 Tax=unclassified Nocardia TaxID=2637762 RepID=UPI0033C49BB0